MSSIDERTASKGSNVYFRVNQPKNIQHLGTSPSQNMTLRYKKNKFATGKKLSSNLGLDTLQTTHDSNVAFP